MREWDQQNRCVWLDSEGLGQFTYYVYGTMDSFSGWGTWNTHSQDTMSACSIAYVTNIYRASPNCLDQQCGAKSWVQETPVLLCQYLPLFPDLTLYGSRPAVVQPHFLAVPQVSPHPVFFVSCPLCQEHSSNILLPSPASKTLCQVNAYSFCKTPSVVS